MQSAPKQTCTNVIATAIILLLIFAGSVQAAGDAQWNAQTKQVNDAIRQVRQACKGDPECMQVIKPYENKMKQLLEQQALFQRNQQQNAMAQMRKQQLDQKQNFMNQLKIQQQFLQQQLASLKKTPELKTIDPFGDYRAHGVSLRPKDGRLQPNMNAKEGSGMDALKEARRLQDSIFPKTPASPSETAPKKGAHDNPLAKITVSNPYANDPNVVDLRGVANPVVPSLIGADPERSLKVNPPEPLAITSAITSLNGIFLQPPKYEIFPNLFPAVPKEQIAQKKSEIEKLKAEMTEIQTERVKKILQIEGMDKRPPFKTYSPSSMAQGLFQGQYLAQESESLAAQMKYKVGTPLSFPATLVDVRKRELQIIKGKHIELGDRLQKANDDLEKLGEQKRLWEMWKKTVDTAPKESLFNGIRP